MIRSLLLVSMEEKKITKPTKKNLKTQIAIKHLPRKGEFLQIITPLLQHLG